MLLDGGERFGGRRALTDHVDLDSSKNLFDGDEPHRVRVTDDCRLLFRAIHEKPPLPNLVELPPALVDNSNGVVFEGFRPSLSSRLSGQRRGFDWFRRSH